jgi:hypothetical protein
VTALYRSTKPITAITRLAPRRSSLFCNLCLVKAYLKVFMRSYGDGLTRWMAMYTSIYLGRVFNVTHQRQASSYYSYCVQPKLTSIASSYMDTSPSSRLLDPTTSSAWAQATAHFMDVPTDHTMNPSFRTPASLELR